MSSFLSGLYLLIRYIPEFVKLANTIIDKLKEAEREEKVKDDLKLIEKAFKEKDAKALHDIFSS
jgi:hypothetical protein